MRLFKKLSGLWQGRPPALLFWAFALIYAAGSFWGMPSAMTPALDSISPLGPLAFVAKYRQVDITYVYPAVHQILQLAVYAAALLGGKLFGAVGAISGAWPYGFRDPSGMFTFLLLLSNWIAAGMGALLLRALWRMRPDPGASQWFAVPLIGLSGVYAYYTRTANMDIPYLFWMVLAWHQIWRHLTEPAAASVRRLLLAGLFSALSFGSKDQASTIVFGFGVLLLLFTPGGVSGWLPRLRQASVFSAAMAVCYAVFAIAPHPARWWYHVRFVTQNPAVHILPETPDGWWGQILLLERCYLRLHHILTYAGLPLAAIGAVVLWRLGRRRELALLLVPALTYYLFVVARVRAPEDRYMLPLALPFALLAGSAIGALGRWHAAGKALGAGVLAAQVVFSLLPVTYCQMFDTKRDLARAIGSIVTPGTAIAVHDMQTMHYPNRDVYERYQLMLWPGQSIVPPSSHVANLLGAPDPNVRYVLRGQPSPPPEGNWTFAGAWTFPAWIKSHVHVAAVHEYYLYQRR